MKGLLVTAAAFLAGLVSGTVADLVSEEVRVRLDRVPNWLIRLAARRLDPVIREDVVDEWMAELAAILDIHRAGPLPLTRLFVGTHYALSLSRSSAAIDHDLSPVHGRHDPLKQRISAMTIFVLAKLVELLIFGTGRKLGAGFTVVVVIVRNAISIVADTIRDILGTIAVPVGNLARWIGWGWSRLEVRWSDRPDRGQW